MPPVSNQDPQICTFDQYCARDISGKAFFLFLEVLLNWLRVGVQWPQEIRLILLFVYTKRKGQKEQKNGEYTT